jgi:hypothetical protein
MYNIDHLIAFYGGRTKMAKELGISYQTLVKRINDSNQLLQHMNEFKDKTKLSADEILKMINTPSA